MSLLFKRESLEGLDESLHSLYQEKDGAFILIVEGAVGEDEVKGLKQNNEDLKKEKLRAKEAKDLAEAERLRVEREAQEAEARKNGNLEAIENSWKEKLAIRENELTEKLRSYEQRNYELTVGRQAQELAGELAKPNAQRLLAKEIKERLTLDENDNIRVLDLQGKLSALTIDELKAQLRADPTYQDIIVINNASGGGATGGGLGGGAGKNGKSMTMQQRADWLVSDPKGFEEAVKRGEFN
jgi:hypothetical protein